jgi:cell volume regulation protein A
VSLTTENIILIGAILLLVSVFAGKPSYKFGVPTLIFFLAIGMLAGSEGIGGINFNDPKIAQFIGIIALNFILFSGGFDTSWHTTKPVLWQGFTMSTLGVVITAVSLGLFVWLVTDFSIYEGLLLGSIVSSTDAAAVFSILRSKKLALKGQLRPLLEFESGSNDPMAYMLTIAFTGLVINQDAGFFSIIPRFIWQFIIGGLLGYLIGVAGKFVINKIKLDYDGLYPVLVIAIMFLAYSVTDFIGGNGFLAVYLSALYLGNQELIHKRTIIKAFDGFAWIMQIILFLTLGLLVFPSHIIPVIGLGLLISAFLILIARPLSVFLSLMFFKVKNRNRLFISWVGLRGAVPIVFATFPLLAGVEKADMIFNIVFFVSLTSVLIQGTTLVTIAKWLHLLLPEGAKKRTMTDLVLFDSQKTEFVEIVLPKGNPSVGKQIVQLELPKTALIVMIQRNEKFISPTGTTVLEPLDKLYVLSEDSESLKQVYESLNCKIEDSET